MRAKLDALAAAWDEHGHGYHVLRAESTAEQDALTKVRKAGLGLLMAASEGRKRPAAFVEDTAVAPERLGPYVERFAAILDRHGLEAGFYGHCSVGCLHIRPFIDLSEQVDTFRAVAEEIKDLVAEFDGVNSSEHGDGRVRSEFNETIFGPELYGAMRKVKAIFDPENRLNPGVMVDPAPMTQDLRDATAPRPQPLVTHLDFGEGGMHAAADRCQRIGACRKTGQGVMCPSYMATREEEHATRGRANALVKALSEPDPAKALGDERLHEILDLCLECKACKSECPLSVDMASMKAEFLSHYNAIHGTPLRSRIFASIRTLNRLGSAFAPLSNLPAPTGLLGITSKRPRPRVRAREPDPLEPQAGAQDRPPRDLPGRLVHDVHRAGCGPRLDRAADGGGLRRAARARGLLRARLDLQRPARRCAREGRVADGAVAGDRRPDHGLRAVLSDDAARGTRAAARRPRRRGAHEARRGAAARRRPAAAQRHAAADPVPRPLPPEGAGRARRRRSSSCAGFPNTEVVELDAGCCGMAGSFGFESEHYELSMRIGGMRLFPAVRREPAETLIAATGVSCRQQITHGTGRSARHPVQIVRDALD